MSHSYLMSAPTEPTHFSSAPTVEGGPLTASNSFANAGNLADRWLEEHAHESALAQANVTDRDRGHRSDTSNEPSRSLHALGISQKSILDETPFVGSGTVSAGSPQRLSVIVPLFTTDPSSSLGTTSPTNGSESSPLEAYSPQLALHSDGYAAWNPKLSGISSCASVCSTSSSSDSFSTAAGNSSSVSTAHSSCGPTQYTPLKPLSIIQDTVSVTEVDGDEDDSKTMMTSCYHSKESKRRASLLAGKLLGKLNFIKRTRALSRSASYYASLASMRRVSEKSDKSDDVPTLVESTVSDATPPPSPPKGILRGKDDQPRRTVTVRQEEAALLKRASRISFVSNVFSPSRKRITTIQFDKSSQSQETYARSEYDRGSDLDAVWTRLTGELAQQIKEELNTFKSNEMKVHDDSVQYTHFFYN